MKHLYIIGNGFDIYTGLRTRFVDFQVWLQCNYAFIYEAMTAAYDIQGEWWCDFEEQLGKLDIKKYVTRFRPPEKTWEQILGAIKERKEFEKKHNLPPSLHFDSECANRLRGLLDVLQYCFERWVEDVQSIITSPSYISIEPEDSFFINFNYTDVLEWLYGISESRVLHIHGRASTKDHLIFGHGQMMLSRQELGYEEEKVGEVLDRYNKNPYEYIYKHKELLPELLKDVEYVHIYGFSFSDVDEGYVDWIYQNTPQTCNWEVSRFSDEDKRRIDRFILNHWNVRKRISLMKLEDIRVKEKIPTR